MNRAPKKKLKQATLSFFTSSPKKRKHEDDTNDEEETKSRRICESTSTTNDIIEVSEDCIPDEVSLHHDVPKNNGEHSSEKSSKTEAIYSEMDVEPSIEQSPIDYVHVPDESVCDKIKMHVPASNDDFCIVDTSTLNTSQQSQVVSESSPSASHTKKLTPKQIQKKKEAEAKKLEREKLKQEKEKERLEKKEAKEKKRLAEIEAKNEEKRQKEEKRKMKEEELRRQKEAEKKAKEEEKQKKVDEIRMKEEQEKKNQEKIAASFKNFFLPKSKLNVHKIPSENSNSSVNSLFMPFEVKENMKLAPKARAILTDERRKYLESVLRESNSIDECNSYLAQMKAKNYKLGHSENTWPLNLNDDDLKDDNLLKTRYKCKLLQFNENRRPAYWGTWRQRSKIVSGKTPFKCDPELEYDIDSDEEWVEEPGESLHGSDDEKESDHEYEVDNELFVPHGYLSDDEANDENQTKKLDLLRTEFEAELKEKTFKLKSRSYGCTWIANDVHKGSNDVEELFLFFRGVYNANLLPFCWKSETENASSGSSVPSSQSMKMKLTFPEHFLPDFIRLAHGNKMSAKNLGIEFCAFILTKEAGVDLSQGCVKRKLKEIGSWDRVKKLWYVRDEVRKQYGVEELSHTENKWDYVTSVASIHCQSKKNTKSTNAVERSPTTTTALQSKAPITPKHIPITNFAKVLTPEERENQLRVTATEKRGELPKNVISPKTTIANYLVRPNESNDAKQPIRKRAALFSQEKDALRNRTANTTPVTSAVDSSITSIITVPSSIKIQVTPVNPVIRAIRDANLKIDDKTSMSETSLGVDVAAENEPSVKMKTSESHQCSTPTSSDQSEGDRKKLSNVTVREGKKYATLISVKKTKGENC